MDLLDAEADQATQAAVSVALTPVNPPRFLKPVESANYTDFYASIHHATRVGRLFRPENPLLPNYKYVPIGYHGRASSLVVSGTPIRRPQRPEPSPPPRRHSRLRPHAFLDYEVEVGMYIGEGNPLGEPIPFARPGTTSSALAAQRLVSARHAVLGNQPLGPFLSKSFATSVSPWVVPMAALAPFRVPPPSASAIPSRSPTYGTRRTNTPAPSTSPSRPGSDPRHARKPASPHIAQPGQLRHLYWTPAQLIAHHTSNGCNLLPGDLLATGTISGREDSAAGCLLELTAGGKKPIQLPNGESRTALEDGDEVILRGFCRRVGFPDVSLGECRGLVALRFSVTFDS
jgi:fumarylacetoacetase